MESHREFISHCVLHAKIFVISLGGKHQESTFLAIVLDVHDSLVFELLQLGLLVLTILKDIQHTIFNTIREDNLFDVF